MKILKLRSYRGMLYSLYAEQISVIFMVIIVHQWYQSLYYPTNAQRKIRRVN